MDSVDEKLASIHKTLTMKHGDFHINELPEQKMSVRFLTGHEKILEIGGNLGRNALVMATILKQQNNNNFVTLETHPEIVPLLIENRDINGFTFHIESAALSKRQLIQHDWDTIPSDTILPGYTKVNIIDWDQLNNKYNIQFDTLVLDCEGAFFYILLDMPEILTNINLILMENDYYNPEHKKFIDNVLIAHGFSVIYKELLLTHPGYFPHCRDEFYQVWKKN